MSILKQTFDIGRDHWQGSILAPVELVQFGDFQSSDCAEIFPEIKLLLETLGSRIRFVYLHFPLHKIHPFATLEVRKASSFLVFARSIGLDMTQFTSDIRRKSLFYKVINDFESGKKSGVHNPPAFFINGHRYNGSVSFEGLYRACKHVYNSHSLVN